MRLFGLSVAIMALGALSAMAAPGDQWILGIDEIKEFPSAFTTYTGAGYAGPQSSGEAQFVGNAYGRQGKHSTARVYWELSGNSIGTNRAVPESVELYSIEFYAPADTGRADWLPVESQIRGGDVPDACLPRGSSGCYDPLIPWVGQFSTNHQWIGSSGFHDRQWHPMDNDGDGGPQAPASADFNAFGDGIYMWLKSNSRLFVKWDFNFQDNPMGRAWSALRLTQVTGTVPPELEGDYNEDGIVDAADYVAWRKTDIDGEPGYQTWVENFGMSAAGAGGSSASGIAAPEPASVALLIGGLAVAAAVGGRQRTRAAVCA